MIPVPLNVLPFSSYVSNLLDTGGKTPSVMTVVPTPSGELFYWHGKSLYNFGNVAVKTAVVNGGAVLIMYTYRIATFGEWVYYGECEYIGGAPCKWKVRIMGYRPRDSKSVQIRELVGTNSLGLIDPFSYASISISVDPISKVGVYAMGMAMNGLLFVGGILEEVGWFSAPDVDQPLVDPAYVNNGYTYNTTGLGSTEMAVLGVGAHNNVAHVSYWEYAGSTTRFRKIADLSSPSLVTVWSEAVKTGASMFGAGFIARMSTTPSTLFNYDGTLSWALAITDSEKIPIQYLGEDASYHYILTVAASGTYKIHALLKAGTTVSSQTLFASAGGSGTGKYGMGDHQRSPKFPFPGYQYVPKNGGYIDMLRVPLMEIS